LPVLAEIRVSGPLAKANDAVTPSSAMTRTVAGPMKVDRDLTSPLRLVVVSIVISFAALTV
jgi:hypothetical protein